MAISDFIEKVCVQTAVLWEVIGNDGYGGNTFAVPIEIKCRWEDYTDTMDDDESIEFISQAKILVTQDFKMGDYLYLGDLQSITNQPDPKQVHKAFPIRAVRKVPMIFSTDVFVRTVYL